MLQQILNDMYIDPELLAELDEEQKQILFCKMREEQVRRWKLREDQLEEEEEKKRIIQPKKSSGKKVTFLVGTDGEPVVVVLGGGAREDVDTLLEERARRQADLEADLLKRAAEEELDKLVRLSRSTVQAMEEEAIRNTHHKERDPAREAVVRSLQEATVEMEGHIQAMEEAESRQRKLPSNIPHLQLPSASSVSTSTSPANGAPIPASSGISSSKLPLSSSASSSSLSSLSSNSSVSLPPSPPAFSISSYGSCHSSTTKKLNGLPMWEAAIKSSNIPVPSTTTSKPPILTPKPSVTSPLSHSPASQSSTQPVVAPDTSGTANGHGSHGSSPPSSFSSTSSTMSSLTPSPPPSLSSPSSPRTPSPLSIVEKDENERILEISSPSSSVVGVAAQIKRFEQLSEGSLEALKTATLERAKKRRQKEILEHLRSQVEAARQQVADASNKQSAEKDDIAWQEQERKAKEAERRIREIARRAREEHRRASHHSPPTHAINRNLNGLTHITFLKNGINGVNGHPGIGGDINGNIKTASEDISNNNNNNISQQSNSSSGGSSTVTKNGHVTGCVRQRLRPPKPPSRASIIAWFREEELPRGAGLEPSRTRIASWFHGIISRTEAEEVLAGAAIGCFLVRVSERIWGYAISYKAADRCRHYLIDVTAGKYTFFGSHQASHDTLSDLVEYHKKEAITTTGGELLTRPCGQPNLRRPNYHELFTGTLYLTV